MNRNSITAISCRLTPFWVAEIHGGGQHHRAHAQRGRLGRAVQPGKKIRQARQAHRAEQRERGADGRDFSAETLQQQGQRAGSECHGNDCDEQVVGIHGMHLTETWRIGG